MRRAAPGFTLLEILIALLVLTMGVLGLAATLGPTAALAARGKSAGRAALILASRLGQLRTEHQAAGGCTGPAPGSLVHASGIRESWTVATDSALVRVTIRVAVPAPSGLRLDSLRSTLPCP
jgi:type II secretory pathway component PulJ